MSEASGSSPAPDGAPTASIDPHKVGRHFVRTYYNALLAKEEQNMSIYYVHSTNTYLSHAEGNEMTSPVTLEEYKPQLEKSNRWGKSDDETMILDMHALDVHTNQSTTDSILIVVTAVMKFVKSKESGRGERQKFFVQTFILARRDGNWGVENDVLRFLVPPTTAPVTKEEETTPTESPVAATAAAPVSPTRDVAVSTETTPSDDIPAESKPTSTASPPDAESIPAASGNESTKATDGEDDAPGGGVEESKEEPPEESDENGQATTTKPPVAESSKKESTTAAESKDEKGKLSKNKGSKTAATPTPNSWASLVATGGSAPNTPSRKATDKTDAPSDAAKPPASTAAEKVKRSEEPKAKPKPKTSEPPPSKQKGASGRTDKKEKGPFNADCTLVIKNLEKATNDDMVKMFAPFAASTKSKLIGVHVNQFRKLAFVDFDAVPPVMAVLKQHADTPFQWHGQVLEVDQKSAEQRARRDAARGGGSYRSGSPGNGARNGGSRRSRGNKGGGRGGGGGK